MEWLLWISPACPGFWVVFVSQDSNRPDLGRWKVSSRSGKKPKEAATIRKEAAIEAKEQILREKNKFEEEVKERRAELSAIEKN